MHFTKLWQIGAGTRHADGVIGDMLVGVVVRTVGPVKPAIEWWLKRMDPKDALAASVKPADDRYVIPPPEVVEGRRSKAKELLWCRA